VAYVATSYSRRPTRRACPIARAFRPSREGDHHGAVMLGYLSLPALQADPRVAARVGETSACAALWRVSRETGARAASAGSEAGMSEETGVMTLDFEDEADAERPPKESSRGWARRCAKAKRPRCRCQCSGENHGRAHDGTA